jgi:hypothetical protein
MPRTGIAHARHIARPHTSHRATCGCDAWMLQRSAPRLERSSPGTAEA